MIECSLCGPDEVSLPSPLVATKSRIGSTRYPVTMPHCRDELEEELYGVVQEHLAKLRTYVPGPVKRAGGKKADLIQQYREDPLFSMFGLDSPEYVAATLSGGTITSIHRKLGDIYEALAKHIFHTTLGLTYQQLTYEAKIMSGTLEETRAADVCLRFAQINDAGARRRVRNFAKAELAKLAPEPKIRLIGVGMEVRQCYQTGDAKRTQADEAMARHLLVAGILPTMPIFCSQSSPTIIRRYRSVWVVKQGLESYDLIRQLSGFDFYDFMDRNRRDFRKPVIDTMRRLAQ